MARAVAATAGAATAGAAASRMAGAALAAAARSAGAVFAAPGLGSSVTTGSAVEGANGGMVPSALASVPDGAAGGTGWVAAGVSVGAPVEGGSEAASG